MTSTLLPPPLAGTCSWPSSKGGPFPQHGPSSCILHPEPHPLDSSTLQGTGARLHVPWSLCSCPHSTLPCSHPVRVPWALTKFSSVTGGPESPPHSHPPSPRASLLFPLSHAHPLPLNPRPSPHLLCSLFPSPTAGILPLVHCPPPWPSSPSLWFHDPSGLSLSQSCIRNPCLCHLVSRLFLQGVFTQAPTPCLLAA